MIKILHVVVICSWLGSLIKCTEQASVKPLIEYSFTQGSDGWNLDGYPFSEDQNTLTGLRQAIMSLEASDQGSLAWYFSSPYDIAGFPRK
jgi:hypothetical protein